ncbi:MAG TPA: phosphopantetheine-binding protein [Bacteroidia bacterium]|nr:phosphopantetheine-binding protein [Bacteroidia bacterium]
MNKEEIENIIFNSLKQIAPDTEPSKLLPDENIRETLGIDSFDFLQFIISLDEKLNLQIPEQDYGKITTLSSLMSYLTQKMK